MTNETTSPAGEAPKPKVLAEGETVTITDSAGRKLTIREPSILEESRLVRMLGDAASNQAYMFGYALPAAMVVEIDGDAKPATTQRQLDAAIQCLGRHGIAAVMEYITGKAKDQQEAGAADAKK